MNVRKLRSLQGILFSINRVVTLTSTPAFFFFFLLLAISLSRYFIHFINKSTLHTPKPCPVLSVLTLDR
ncbi:hypothetical protein Hdeb2414_s0012g00383701 [Helianthus debilis subsp. tardiflorus]